MSSVIIHRERGAYMQSLYWRIIDQKEWFRLHEETEAMDDPANHWTYVRPHEDYCGPYFCSPA